MLMKLWKGMFWLGFLVLIVVLAQLYFTVAGPQEATYVSKNVHQFLTKTRWVFFWVRASIVLALLYFADSIVMHYLAPPADDVDAKELALKIVKRFRHQILTIAVIFESLYWLTFVGGIHL